jgi:hypothetical protein
MSRAQDVLDWIDAMHDLCERHSSILAYERYGIWGTGIQLHYQYVRSSPRHLRINGASLL